MSPDRTWISPDNDTPCPAGAVQSTCRVSPARVVAAKSRAGFRLPAVLVFLAVLNLRMESLVVPPHEWDKRRMQPMRNTTFARDQKTIADWLDRGVRRIARRCSFFGALRRQALRQRCDQEGNQPDDQ